VAARPAAASGQSVALTVGGQLRVLVPALDQTIGVRAPILAEARQQLGPRQSIEQLAGRIGQLILDSGRPLIAGRQALLDGQAWPDLVELGVQGGKLSQALLIVGTQAASGGDYRLGEDVPEGLFGFRLLTPSLPSATLSPNTERSP